MKKLTRPFLLTSLLLLSGGAWWFYPTTPQAWTTGQTVILAGQVRAGIDSLGPSKITVTLVGSNCYTSGDLMPSFSRVTYAALATGKWAVTLIGTDSITCQGGAKPTYTVRIEHPVLEQSGQVIEYSGLVIPATNGDTTQLRSIVAAQ